MEPSDYEIHELRCKFFEKLENEHGSNTAYFHSTDLARVSNYDQWLKRFLIHHDMEMKDALQMLWETCEWRKENKVHEVNENTVNREYLEEGAIFIRNRDKDGKSMLILKCKKHVKGQKDFEELKKVVIYWFERAERKDKGEPISLFFDMTDTGLNNMDMEYTKYLINLFKQYYPHFLNYILIFEMPWILNTAFKMIKGWLPTKAVQKIKFVSRSNLKEFVEPDQSLECWGGMDDYTFKFVSEILDTPSIRLDDYKKKVHFADGSPLVEAAPSFSDIYEENMEPSASKLLVRPSETVTFSYIHTGELASSMNLLNASDQILTYKIKTTSPEKFRVRPSSGVLAPTNWTKVEIVFQPGHPPGSIPRYKFLVMSFTLDDPLTSPTELAELWKTADSKKIDQHKLRCVLSEKTAASTENGAEGSSLSHTGAGDSEQKINQIFLGLNHLNHCHNQLEADLRLSNRLHIFTLVLLLLMGGALLYLLQRFPQSLETSKVSCYEPIPPPTEECHQL